MPSTPGIVLDVSAAASDWFAAAGWEVVAIGRRPPGAASPSVKWVSDSLPYLLSVRRLALTFDLVWVGDALSRIAPTERRQALRNLVCQLKFGGRLVVMLPDGQPGLAEIERLGANLGLALRLAALEEGGGLLVMELLDDGGGSLPLLRGLILNQEKSATYKLALLRCVLRIADASPNVVREVPDHVELPLGLVALNWIRMFKPLVAQGLPQRPGERMGFASDAFHALAPVPAGDLRLGLVLDGAGGEALRRALAHAARSIVEMPATHLTFADGSPVFPTVYGRMPAGRAGFTADLESLWSYGSLLVPRSIWESLRRMAAWIEPMLVAEWGRLTIGYAARQGRPVVMDEVIGALRWTEPGRDTAFVRGIALRRLADGHDLRCVWSGRRLRAPVIDIDHCLPWSAWPCGDLWNLLPAAPAVNRHGKRERIVSSAALRGARGSIVGWWNGAYLEGGPALRRRFAEEAHAALPVAAEAALDLDELFQALDFRRLRLLQETRLPQWAGMAASEG